MLKNIKYLQIGKSRTTKEFSILNEPTPAIAPTPPGMTNYYRRHDEEHFYIIKKYIFI
jgi:hypothetical protein